MRKQGGAEQKMKTIKDEQGAALFERPFRAQETNAPHGCGLEWHFSSMLWLQGRLERSPVGCSAAPGQARAAPVDHSAVWGRLERPPSGVISFFVAICMGFKALPTSFVHRCMGFKQHHIKTYVNTSENT